MIIDECNTYCMLMIYRWNRNGCRRNVISPSWLRDFLPSNQKRTIRISIFATETWTDDEQLDDMRKDIFSLIYLLSHILLPRMYFEMHFSILN